MATMYYRPYTSEPIKDGDMPPHDAMNHILPEYQYLFVDPDGKSTDKKKQTKRSPLDDDKTSHSLLEHQMRELDKYRNAVYRLGQEIVALREQIRILESTNSKLRIQLTDHNDATQLLVDSAKLDGLTKPELASRYISAKNSLHQYASELGSYKDRVQKLQNQLIKKNDNEKQYLQIKQAHHSQNELIQRLQDKASRVRRLEETIRKQESVIQKMEQNQSSSYNNAQDIMQEDYRRIRSELSDLQEHNHKLAEAHDNEITDKFRIQQQLDSANSRIYSLEKQLHDNARSWAQERQDLKMKLSTADFDPVHSYPKITGQPRYEIEPRRYSKSKNKPKPLRGLRHGSPQLEPLRN